MRETDKILEIPALLGLHRGFLIVKIIDGKPCDIKTGAEITVSHTSIMHYRDPQGSIYGLSNGAHVAAKHWPWK